MENIEKLPFSKVTQIGVVVRNLDKAIDYYESLGIGPFQIFEGIKSAKREVYGKSAPDVKNRIAHCQMGAVSFELVQPVSGKSIQKEFLECHGEGINHLGFLVNDIEEELAKLVKRGFKVISRVKVNNGGGAYLDTDKVGGVLFELMQLSPETLAELQMGDSQ